jgi:hypothetical protein
MAVVKDLGSTAVNLSRVSGDALIVQATKAKGARGGVVAGAHACKRCWRILCVRVCVCNGCARAAKETLESDTAVASASAAGAGAH